MIQRLQSVWLLLAAAAAFCSLRFSFYSGNMVAANAKSWVNLTAQSNLLLLILTAGVGIAALIDIFLYKNRKQQSGLAWITFLVSIINLILYFVQVQKFVPGEGSYNLTALFAIIVPVFLLLAIRGIRKDQKLVKSLDRLR